MSSVKALLLGDTGVGKTCISSRFVDENYSSEPKPTIGAASLSRTIEVCDRTVTFNIWDTAGQERYRGLAPMYFNGAGVAFLVFDITQRSTFACLDQFYTLLKQRAPENIVTVVVGNKIDLLSMREVSREEGQEYATKIGAEFYLETSAVDGTNIFELFAQTAQLPNLPFEPEVADFVIDLRDGAERRDDKKSCC